MVTVDTGGGTVHCYPNFQLFKCIMTTSQLALLPSCSQALIFTPLGWRVTVWCVPERFVHENVDAWDFLRYVLFVPWRCVPENDVYRTWEGRRHYVVMGELRTVAPEAERTWFGPRVGLGKNDQGYLVQGQFVSASVGVGGTGGVVACRW
jgi:hypothetical protein